MSAITKALWGKVCPLPCRWGRSAHDPVLRGRDSGSRLPNVKVLLLMGLMAVAGLALGQGSGEQKAMRLWEGDAPGALGKADKDIPTITAFLPASPNGTAMVVCPGGSYAFLSPREGKDYALFLNMLGISAYVLKSRLGPEGYHHPVELQDVARALRMVRAHAVEWKLDPMKIGIIGSSAGGHLASTLLTHFDAGSASSSDPIERVSSRPDFGVLCYPVISMGPMSHKGSRDNLLGSDQSPKVIEKLSNELHVTPETPPCFLFHTVADDAVPVENSLLFAAALQKNKVPFDLHLYQKGGHGIALGDDAPYTHVHPWVHDMVFWLRENGWIK